MRNDLKLIERDDNHGMAFTGEDAYRIATSERLFIQRLTTTKYSRRDRDLFSHKKSTPCC